MTIRKLLKAALRMSPDRILLSEEAFDLLQAMNTGHSGSLSTIHAGSGGQTLRRFATCIMMSGIDLPHRTVRANIGEALHLLVNIERREGKRYVTEVLRVQGYDPSHDLYEFETVYARPGS